MTTANFIPEVWSARLLVNLRKNFVFKDIVNMDYQGEIRGAGDTVDILTPSAVTVNNYSGSVTYEDVQSTKQKLLIDQQKYWAFDVDDVDAVQANVNLIDTYMQEAAVALADSVDQNLASLYTEAGASVNLDVSSNDDGVRTALLSVAQELDEANVPQSGRWMVVSPRVFRSIKGNSSYSAASELGDMIKMSGAIGMLEGFNIYVSNNVQISTQHKCLAGYRGCITYAEQLVNTEAIRREGSFADAMRGLLVFGRKVTRPGALVVLNTTVA